MPLTRELIDAGWTPQAREAAATKKGGQSPGKEEKSGSGSERGGGGGRGGGHRGEAPTNTTPAGTNPSPPPDQHLGNVEEIPKRKKRQNVKRTAESYSEETADKRRKKVQARDPFGREAGTYEEEDGMSDPDLFETVGDAAYSQRLSMCDTIELDDKSGVKFTRDGVLKAMPRIARTGIQIYGGDETGCPDKDLVRVYRPAASVFANDTVHSYTHLPVTIDHPPEMVTPQNWRKYAVGDTGDEFQRDQDGNVLYARVPMMLRDSAAIQAFKEGMNQLSVGYECDLNWTPGITDDGEEYDAIQTNIRANHLAVVTNARGGDQLKIGDGGDKDGQHHRGYHCATGPSSLSPTPDSTSLPTSWQGEKAMNLKNVTVDGIECQMTDTAAALVQKTIKTLNDRYEKLSDEYDKFKKKKDDDDDDCKDSIKKAEDSVKAKDAEIAVLNKKVTDAEWTPERIEDEIGKRLDVIDKARTYLGDKLNTKGKSLNDIRKQVVDIHMGDAAKDWDAVKVEAGFAAITKDGKRPSGNSNQFADVVRAFAQPMHPVNVGDAESIKQQAYDECVKDTEQAWKRLGQGAQ